MTDPSQERDGLWNYIRCVEQAAARHLPGACGPLDVAREIWGLHARDQPFDTGWGYHVSLELFLTVASLLDRDERLLRELDRPGAIVWPSIVRFIDGAKLLDGDDIFEIGGCFLDLLDPTRQRSYDARFDPRRSLRVDRPSPAPKNLQLIFASGLFEESSGIHKTLVDGPCSKQELAPIFAARGIPIEHYDTYRREQSQIASIELFAWARNHLAAGGFLVVNNALSPSVSPSRTQLPLLGFSSYAKLFEATSQDGAFIASVSVYRAEQPTLADRAITAKCAFYSRIPDRGKRLPVYRRRQWRWEGRQLQAAWLDAT